MIVVDTSALVAILRKEPEADVLARVIAAASRIVIGAPTKFEFLLVTAALRRAGGEQDAINLLARIDAEVLEWTSEHADLAFGALMRFGKGRHPAALNFGDCMTYAVAKALNAPLLFKGGDFTKTDIVSALPIQ